jgi:hypothetical protein
MSALRSGIRESDRGPASPDLSPINRFGHVEEFDVYAYYCPGCGAQVGCEVQLAEEPAQPGDVLA